MYRSLIFEKNGELQCILTLSIPVPEESFKRMVDNITRCEQRRRRPEDEKPYEGLGRAGSWPLGVFWYLAGFVRREGNPYIILILIHFR